MSWAFEKSNVLCHANAIFMHNCKCIEFITAALECTVRCLPVRYARTDAIVRKLEHYW